MRKVMAVAVGFVALALSKGTAYADNPDQAFLNAVAAQGISGDPAQLIADGHAACDNYGTPGMATQMMALMGRGMSNIQASNLQLAGIRAYCPVKIAGSPLG